jgi:hypothetical protein
MKEILSDLSEVGFLKAKDYPGKSVDKQITPEAILKRFQEKKEVPSEILLAIRNMSEEESKKRAAIHLLRIALYAKTIASGNNIFVWFEKGKVTDPGTDAKISVSAIKSAATNFNKAVAQLEKNKNRAAELQNSKKQLTKRQISSLDIVSAKADALDPHVKDLARLFLLSLDHIYLSLASERK